MVTAEAAKIGERFVMALAVAVFCVGCAQRRPIVQTEYRDSVRVVERRDSVWVERMDSVFVDRWRSGDTMYITKERWRVEYRDRIREVRDTIRDTQTRTETIEKRYIPFVYRLAMGFAVGMLVVGLIYIMLKRLRRFRVI